MPASRSLLRRRSMPLVLALIVLATGTTLLLAPPSHAQAAPTQTAAPSDAAFRRAVDKNAERAVQRQLQRQTRDRQALQQPAAAVESRSGGAIR